MTTRHIERLASELKNRRMEASAFRCLIMALLVLLVLTGLFLATLETTPHHVRHLRCRCHSPFPDERGPWAYFFSITLGIPGALCVVGGLFITWRQRIARVRLFEALRANTSSDHATTWAHVHAILHEGRKPARHDPSAPRKTYDLRLPFKYACVFGGLVFIIAATQVPIVEFLLFMPLGTILITLLVGLVIMAFATAIVCVAPLHLISERHIKHTRLRAFSHEAARAGALSLVDDDSHAGALTATVSGGLSVTHAPSYDDATPPSPAA